MAKKKKKAVRRRKKSGIFGKSFNVWDLILIALIVASGWYIFALEGARSLIDTIIRGVFFALIIGTMVRFIVRRSGG